MTSNRATPLHRALDWKGEERATRRLAKQGNGTAHALQEGSSFLGVPKNFCAIAGSIYLKKANFGKHHYRLQGTHTHYLFESL